MGVSSLVERIISNDKHPAREKLFAAQHWYRGNDGRHEIEDIIIGRAAEDQRHRLGGEGLSTIGH